MIVFRLIFEDRCHSYHTLAILGGFKQYSHFCVAMISSQKLKHMSAWRLHARSPGTTSNTKWHCLCPNKQPS